MNSASNGTAVAHSNGVAGSPTKISKAHEHPSPSHSSSRQPVAAHSHTSSSNAHNGSSGKNHKNPSASNVMNLSTSPPHHHSSPSAASNANNSALAAAAATLLSQAAASFLSAAATSAPVAHQHSSPPSAASPSFNIANIIGKTNDLPREAHGRTQPHHTQKQASPSKSSPAVAASSLPLFSDNNAVLEALAMAMACGGFPSPQTASSLGAILPQQAKPLSSPPSSPSSHLKHHNHAHHHRRKSPVVQVDGHAADLPSNNNNVNNSSNSSKRISVKTAAKKAEPCTNSAEIYDFVDHVNESRGGKKREAKSPVAGQADASPAKKPTKNTPQPESSNKKKSVSSASKSKSNGSTSNGKSSTPKKKSSSSSSNANHVNSQNRRRKLVREQDDDDDMDLGPGEEDDWVESTQPFHNKVYLQFDWKFPPRKADNPFTNPVPSRSTSAMSNHRNNNSSSPNNGIPIMKAPKAMMRKSGKRKSK